MEEDFKAIILECVIPGVFPEVALFVKGGSGNYILYKSQDISFTRADQQRLERSGASHVYIRCGDVGLVTSYLESNLSSLIMNDELSERAKTEILYQTTMEYVAELMGNPNETMADMSRCRSLVKSLMSHMVSSENLLAMLREVLSGSMYILSHSAQVAALTMLVHEKAFQIDRDEMLDVGIGGLLHDIGMTFLSEDILEKPETLSNIEYDLVKKHPQLGHDFLKKFGVTSEVSLAVVLYHHEKWNGSGYPRNFRENGTPRSAQVAAICDTYCALVSERPYRKASTPAKAIALIQSEAGNSFSAEMVAHLRAVVE
jgi:HD-GYP domain-containing protein (c-di-GMP phosphodiesterase class II)